MITDSQNHGPLETTESSEIRFLQSVKMLKCRHKEIIARYRRKRWKVRVGRVLSDKISDFGKRKVRGELKLEEAEVHNLANETI